MDNRMCFLLGDIGLRTIPKCGSTTIRRKVKNLREASRDDLCKVDYVVAVIRNPVDRLISAWRSHCGRPGRVAPTTWQPVVGRTPTPEEFLEAIIKCSDEERDYHWKSFDSMLEGIEPKKQLVILPLERFPDVWDKTRRHLRELPQLLGGRENQTSHKWSPTEIPQELRERVQEEYASSYDLWERAMNGEYLFAASQI